jgi:hypothetical protein
MLIPRKYRKLREIKENLMPAFPEKAGTFHSKNRLRRYQS